ncbi:Spo0E family sporulation regulatory protein-aspartic acid phosphatase [Ferroacidibacillus organovorans]|uniref:Spo0E family sporulation regulatory protein-aspartic acid phosphatase n=1 Tax=Ferroacidibacillus organovorans TaxID=1765683 RepID=UPI001365E85C|nr:Spo0E family sporulation regulatory protein-aspartic acid phosphatase [Ferroacidibacillus organovorans]
MSAATLEAAIDSLRSEMDTLYNGTNRLDDPKLLDLSVKLDKLVIEAMKDKN